MLVVRRILKLKNVKGSVGFFPAKNTNFRFTFSHKQHNQYQHQAWANICQALQLQFEIWHKKRESTNI